MATATRSALRSATAAATRCAAGAKPVAARSPFCIPAQNQKPLSHSMFRSPVEMSCVTMLPFRTASALLTSMLSLTRRTYGSTLEGLDKTN